MGTLVFCSSLQGTRNAEPCSLWLRGKGDWLRLPGSRSRRRPLSFLLQEGILSAKAPTLGRQKHSSRFINSRDLSLLGSTIPRENSASRTKIQCAATMETQGLPTLLFHGILDVLQQDPATWSSSLAANSLFLVVGFPALHVGLTVPAMASAFFLGTVTWKAFGPQAFLLLVFYFILSCRTLTLGRRDDILAIVDSRWEFMRRPIHGMVAILHPFYKTPELFGDIPLLTLRSEYLNLMLSEDDQLVIDGEMSSFMNNLGPTYLRSVATRSEATRFPLSWWQNYGRQGLPQLCKLALRILSQTFGRAYTEVMESFFCSEKTSSTDYIEGEGEEEKDSSSSSDEEVQRNKPPSSLIQSPATNESPSHWCVHEGKVEEMSTFVTPRSYTLAIADTPYGFSTSNSVNDDVKIKPNIHGYKLDHLSWACEFATIGFYSSLAMQSKGSYNFAMKPNRTNVFEQPRVCKKFKHTGADVQGVINSYQKPQLLMMDLIDLPSMRGEWIMDLFAGTGTTTVSALKRGRNVIAVEGDPLQVKFIEQRVTALKELPDEFQEVGMKSMASDPRFFDASGESQPPIGSESWGDS
ncbi:hypothetical protein L7F22_030880 [Adiantum nelumboides]|nr:hypothetical protein [Adiantum nelumboides]